MLGVGVGVFCFCTQTTTSGAVRERSYKIFRNHASRRGWRYQTGNQNYHRTGNAMARIIGQAIQWPES